MTWIVHPSARYVQPAWTVTVCPAGVTFPGGEDRRSGIIVIVVVKREAMRLVVSRRTHELVTSDMPGLEVPRRTVFGRYDYGEVPMVVVDLVIDRLADVIDAMPKPPKQLRTDHLVLRIDRDPPPWP
ncbi:hypothetical protein [Mycobacteroides abscessus]|uniref:hypothetical protein n=1 Tax=Mycobacteroides abscessus TaxID=36809 RepID=UPI0010421CBB|nr:hypothetical protein [Mycobacteroides abscessus]